MFIGESRNEAIIRLYKEKKSHRDIQKALKVGFSTIATVIEQYRNQNIIPDQAKRGRPKKIGNTMLTQFIKQQTLENRRVSCTKIADSWNYSQAHYFSISPESVRRVRHDLNFHYKPPKIRQKLTTKQMRKRYIFSQSVLQREDFDITKIVFSDESRICLGPDSRFIWYQPGEIADSVFIEHSKAEVGVMVWAAIGLNYKSELIICRKNIDAKEYRNVIKKSNMVQIMNEKNGNGNWCFMQDGAPAHTAKETQTFLVKRMNILANWPANSPDLNPIEHLWAILKYRIRKDNPATVADLINAIKTEWDEITIELINSLVLSFKKRLLLCCQQHGKQIGSLLNSFKEENIGFEPIDDENLIEILIAQCPDINDVDDSPNRDFSIEDDQLLLKLYTEMGPRWTKMSAYFQNHSSINLRNRFISIRGRDSLKKRLGKNTNELIVSEFSIESLNELLENTEIP